MRYRRTKEILHEVHNNGLGDALLFRVSPELEHRVQGVEGDVPKTALAGWFVSGTTFHQGAGERVNCSASGGPVSNLLLTIPASTKPG
jgi:hypothetical protein